jgi:hypothetical protein
MTLSLAFFSSTEGPDGEAVESSDFSEMDTFLKLTLGTAPSPDDLALESARSSLEEADFSFTPA